MIKEHYAAANVPMLPGTKGERETTRQILLYSIVMVAFTVAVGWWLGPVYTVAAVAPRRLLPPARLEAPPRHLTPPRVRAVPLLARLPGAAVRGRSRRSPARLGAPPRPAANEPAAPDGDIVRPGDPGHPPDEGGRRPRCCRHTPHVRQPPRLPVLAALVAATLVSGAALAKGAKPQAPPQNLRGFLLRPSEPLTHVFPRTPAFAWAPVRGALCYEFELATSRSFSESSVVWSNVRTGVKPGTGCAAVAANTPAAPGSRQAVRDPPAAVRVRLLGHRARAPAPRDRPPGRPARQAAARPRRPQRRPIQPCRPRSRSCGCRRYPSTSRCRGSPASRTRSTHTCGRSRSAGTSRLEHPLRVQHALARRGRQPLQSVPGPRPLDAGQGATSYQVWFPSISKVVSTHINVVDQREFYAFHPTRAGRTTVKWRVRAVRRVRRHPERASPRLLRPLEPRRSRRRTPTSRRASSIAAAGGLRQDQHACEADVARADAGFRVHRSTRVSTASRTASTGRTSSPTSDCVNIGLPRRHRRRPRLRCPRRRAAEAAHRARPTSRRRQGQDPRRGDEGATLGADGFPVTTSEGQRRGQPPDRRPARGGRRQADPARNRRRTRRRRSISSTSAGRRPASTGRSSRSSCPSSPTEDAASTSTSTCPRTRAPPDGSPRSARESSPSVVASTSAVHRPASRRRDGCSQPPGRSPSSSRRRSSPGSPRRAPTRTRSSGRPRAIPWRAQGVEARRTDLGRARSRDRHLVVPDPRPQQIQSHKPQMEWSHRSG